MSKDVVATSANIDNITKMLNLLQRVKEDSGKIREISLDDTGWEGMDATAFNNSLNNFTKKLDTTSTDIEEALSSYKTKQQQQLELTDETAKVADNLDQNGAHLTRKNAEEKAKSVLEKNKEDALNKKAAAKQYIEKVKQFLKDKNNSNNNSNQNDKNLGKSDTNTEKLSAEEKDSKIHEMGEYGRQLGYAIGSGHSSEAGQMAADIGETLGMFVGKLMNDDVEKQRAAAARNDLELLSKYDSNYREQGLKPYENKVNEAKEGIIKDYGSPISYGLYNKAKAEYDRASSPYYADEYPDIYKEK